MRFEPTFHSLVCIFSDVISLNKMTRSFSITKSSKKSRILLFKLLRRQIFSSRSLVRFIFIYIESLKSMLMSRIKGYFKLCQTGLHKAIKPISRFNILRLLSHKSLYFAVESKYFLASTCTSITKYSEILHTKHTCTQL